MTKNSKSSYISSTMGVCDTHIMLMHACILYLNHGGMGKGGLNNQNEEYRPLSTKTIC